MTIFTGIAIPEYDVRLMADRMRSDLQPYNPSNQHMDVSHADMKLLIRMAFQTFDTAQHLRNEMQALRDTVDKTVYLLRQVYQIAASAPFADEHPATKEIMRLLEPFK